MSQHDADLEVLKAAIQREKNLAFELLMGIVRGDFELRTMGYKSIEDATTKIMGSAMRTIEKITVAFERKYPL